MDLLPKKFNSPLKSSILFALVTFLQPAINFVLTPYYLKLLSPKEFGILTLINSAIVLLGTIGALKISSAVVVFYFDFKEKKDQFNLLSTSLNFAIVFNFLLGLIIFIIGDKLFISIFKSSSLKFYPYGILAIFISSFQSIFQIYTSFVKNTRELFKYALVQILYVFLYSISLIYTVSRYKEVGILFSRIFAYSLVLVIVFYQIRKSYTFRIDKSLVLKMLRYSISLIPFFVLFWISKYVDRFILEKYIDLSQLGVYGLLMTICGFIIMASQVLANSVQPFLFKLYNNPSKNNTKIHDLNLLYIDGLLLSISMVILFSSFIFYLEINPLYYEIFPTLYIAIIPSIINGISYLFFNILTFGKKSGMLSGIAFISTFVQTLLILFVVQKFNILGVIISMIISNTIIFIMYYRKSREILLIQTHELKLFVKPLILMLLCLLAYFTHPHYNNLLIGAIIFMFTIMTIIFSKHTIKFLKNWKINSL